MSFDDFVTCEVRMDRVLKMNEERRNRRKSEAQQKNPTINPNSESSIVSTNSTSPGNGGSPSGKGTLLQSNQGVRNSEQKAVENFRKDGYRTKSLEDRYVANDIRTDEQRRSSILKEIEANHAPVPGVKASNVNRNVGGLERNGIRNLKDEYSTKNLRDSYQTNNGKQQISVMSKESKAIDVLNEGGPQVGPSAFVEEKAGYPNDLRNKLNQKRFSFASSDKKCCSLQVNVNEKEERRVTVFHSDGQKRENVGSSAQGRYKGDTSDGGSVQPMDCKERALSRAETYRNTLNHGDNRLHSSEVKTSTIRKQQIREWDRGKRYNKYYDCFMADQDESDKWEASKGRHDNVEDRIAYSGSEFFYSSPSKDKQSSLSHSYKKDNYSPIKGDTVELRGTIPRGFCDSKTRSLSSERESFYENDEENSNIHTTQKTSNSSLHNGSSRSGFRGKNVNSSHRQEPDNEPTGREIYYSSCSGTDTQEDQCDSLNTKLSPVTINPTTVDSQASVQSPNNDDDEEDVFF